MQKLGERLGQGATAEVYVYGEDQVVKLVKSTSPASIIDYEAWVTRTVSAAGAAAPTVKEFVEIDGRRGFVMERVRGRPLLEVWLAGEITVEECGRILAELCHSLHILPGGATGLRSLHDFAYPMLTQLDERGFSHRLLDGTRQLLSTLDRGKSICHGDLNPNNVLMTPDGPRIIDWISAMTAHPMVDVARIMVTLSVTLIPEALHPGISVDTFWGMRRRFCSVYLETYATLAGLAQDTLQADLEPWMTVMATLALAEGTPEQQAWLVAYLEKRIL